jgi:hypothetical protein
MKNAKWLPVFIFSLLFIILFVSCSNTENIEACLDGKQFGFWNGLWHGIIAPVDLVLMLFRDDISVYATNNNGAWYAFGFLIGSGGWGVMGGKGLTRKKKKEHN